MPQEIGTDPYEKTAGKFNDNLVDPIIQTFHDGSAQNINPAINRIK